MDACKQNIEEFLRRDLGRWTGLRTGCAKGDVTRWFPFNEGEGVAHHGTRNVEYSFRSLPHPGFTEGVFFYFGRDQDQLSFIATEFWSFDRRECADLLRQLGEPSHRLDFYWKDEQIEKAEWLYPERGVAIGVIPATKLIARVTAYPPCAPDVYRESFYQTGLTREFRASGG